MDSNISFLDFCKSLKLNNPKTGYVSFDLFEHQKTLFNAFENNKRVIVKKFRQGGFTTLFALYALWKLITEKSVCCFYTSRTDRCCIDFMQLIKNFINNSDIRFSFIFNSKTHEIFCEQTGSTIYAYPIKACCGKSIQYALVDEAVLTDYEWSILVPMLVSKVLIAETPSLSNDSFKEIYRNVRDHKAIGIAYQFNGEDFFPKEKIEEWKKTLGDSYRGEIQAKFTKKKQKTKATFSNLNQALSKLTTMYSKAEILEQVIASLYLKGTNNEKGKNTIN